MPYENSNIFPPVIRQWIAENVKGKESSVRTAELNAAFGSDYTCKQVMAYKKNHKLTSGVDMRFSATRKNAYIPQKGTYTPGSEKGWFKKGNQPHNHLPVGSEVKDGEGYVKIKIAEPNRWRYKHRLVYEQFYGAIPPGGLVIFADGNIYNFEPENLVVMTRSENAYTTSTNLRSTDASLTKTGLAVAKIDLKIREIEKKGRTV